MNDTVVRQWRRRGLALAMWSMAVMASAGGLSVVNGDFSDLSGMTEGTNSWCAGVPKGWRGSPGQYAVHATQGPSAPVCNPSSLGILRQEVGVVPAASDVTLAFDVSEPWKTNSSLFAAVLDADFRELACGELFQPGWRHELTAARVPAGARIIVAFQSIRSAPGLDNIEVIITPCRAQRAAAPSITRVSQDGQPLPELGSPCPIRLQRNADGRFELRARETGRYTLVGSDGREQALDFSPPAPMELSNSWNIAIPSLPTLGSPLVWPRLISWTDHPNDAAKDPSGTATYATQLDLTADALAPDRPGSGSTSAR